MRQSDDRRVWVHIGPPKTGTSSLQNFLHHNRQILIDRGFLYPSLRPEGGDGESDPGEPTGVKHDYLLLMSLREASSTIIHRRLTEAGIDPKLAAKRCDEAFRGDMESHGTHQVVLSSEAFGNTFWEQPDAVGELVSYLRQYTDDVVFVIYVRHPLYHARSHQQHLVKSGYWSLAAADEPYQFPFVQVIRTISAVVGVDSVRVRRFGRDFDRSYDVVQDFADVIDLDVSGLARPTFHGNRGLTMASALLLDSLNRVLGEGNAGCEHKKRRRSAQLIPHDVGSAPFRLSRAVESLILESSRDDMAVLADKYGVDFPGLEEGPNEIWDQQAIDDIARHLFESATELRRLRSLRKRAR